MFNTICSFEHLLESYRLARRDNRYKRQVCRFDLFLEQNLFKLQWELQTGRYSPYPYTYFIVSDPKTRHVAAPNFRDRVFHHSLVSIIEPLFDNSFITDSYACRKEKGTHYAKGRVKKFLQAARSIYGKETLIYILQCDISKFFSSISWDVLETQVKEKITDPKIQSLLTSIITTHIIYAREGKLEVLPQQVVSPKERKGVPIGNLTSQLFANIYLNPLDHFVKEKLKARFYGRYMDDFFIIHPDKEFLKQARREIQEYLWQVLRLTLHPRKTIIQNVQNGVTFVGYRIFYDHVLIRGNTLRRFQRKYTKRKNQFKDGIITQGKLTNIEFSFKGHLQYANAYGLKNFLFLEKQNNLEREALEY